MTKLYRASSDFIGDASLNVEQRSMLKVKSLCQPILENDPWVPGQTEADEIKKIVLEEMGLQLVPRGQDDKRKYDMIFLRDDLSLRVVKSHIPTCDISHQYAPSAK
jgi:hypothetical protein